MAKKKTQNNTGSSQLTGHLLIYGLILAAGIGLGIVPQLQEKTEIGIEIKKVQAEIQRQETLYPVYEGLMVQLSEQLIQTLPLPGKRQLSEGELEIAKQQLRELAQQQNLRVIDIHHDPLSLEQHGGQVLVLCKMSGDFMNFRNYLVTLGATDFVKHIELVEMQENGEGIVINLKVRLSVASNG